MNNDKLACLHQPVNTLYIKMEVIPSHIKPFLKVPTTFTTLTFHFCLANPYTDSLCTADQWLLEGNSSSVDFYHAFSQYNISEQEKCIEIPSLTLFDEQVDQC